MYINTTGLVLRETVYKDSSRILTVLTASEGKLTVSARGAKRRGSRTAAATQLLAYSDMTLFSSGDRWLLTEAQSIELFSGLSEDVGLLALGSYFAELLETVSDEDSPNPELLQLGLNALFVLSEGKKVPALVKAAFELRLICLAGFAPALDGCAVCGAAEPALPSLDLTGGVLCCGNCRAIGSEKYAQLCAGSLEAMRHITECDPKKLFSFTIGSEALVRLSHAAEAYLLVQLDRGFRTLDFYNSLLSG